MHLKRDGDRRMLYTHVTLIGNVLMETICIALVCERRHRSRISLRIYFHFIYFIVVFLACCVYVYCRCCCCCCCCCCCAPVVLVDLCFAISCAPTIAHKDSSDRCLETIYTSPSYHSVFVIQMYILQCAQQFTTNVTMN